MADVQIEELFDNKRFPRGVYLVPLLVYFLLGVIIFLLRVLVGIPVFLISCILPKRTSIRSVVLRSMCSILGISVTTEGHEHRDKKVKIMVANYTSTLDHLAVDLVIASILPCVWDLPPALMWLLGYVDMGAKQGRDTLIKNAQKHTKDSRLPLLVFPEGASTNGRVGLLKFSVWPFSLDQPVQPLLIRLHRPKFTQVAPSVLGGRWWIDLCWFLFVPYTKFHIKVLPVMQQSAGESVADFTLRAQRFLAAELGLQATCHTSADKVEYAKRKLFVQIDAPSSPSNSSPQHVSKVTDIMACQVKEVLPHVPTEVIYQDLLNTKDVDQTITRLLEGIVAFKPVVESASAQSDLMPSPPQHSPKAVTQEELMPKPADTAAKSFSGQSSVRQESLEERKCALIEKARRRYMEKHGLS